MSNPNSQNSYAGAVKKQSTSTGPSSSSAAISSVSKRKRQSSSSSDSSSSSSSSANTFSGSQSLPAPFHGSQCPNRDLSKFKQNIDRVFVEESPAGMESIVECKVKRKIYIDSVCAKFIRDASFPPKSISTQTEDDDALIEKYINENKQIELDEKATLHQKLSEESDKSAAYAKVIGKILDLSISGLSSAQNKPIVRKQTHAYKLSAFIDIKPKTQVFDEVFWGPMKALHVEWDKEAEDDELIMNDLKNAISSIVGECRDLLQIYKKPHPLVTKSKILCSSLNDNRIFLAKSKEAKRSQSSRLCNSPPNTSSFTSNKNSKASYDNSENDKRFLKARKVRFEKRSNDSPTSSFIEPESSQSLIEIEIPNVKITVPFKNQVLANEFEFSAEFPNLREIVNEKVKKFRETHESFELDQFDVSQNSSNDTSVWEEVCKNESHD